MTDNPLIDYPNLPPFALIRPEHVAPAVESTIADARVVVERLLADPATPDWEHFVEPLNAATERIGRVWGPVSHLNSVVNTPELREAYNSNLPKISAFFTELGQNLALFEKYKALVASPAYAQLSAPQQKVLQNELRDFRLSGAELPDSDKPRFTEIQLQLADLDARFEQNLLDATDAFAYYASEAEIDGVPADVKAMYRAAAEADGKDGYKITLQFPFYYPLMQYGTHRPLRETLYRAYVTRASEFGKEKWNNAPLIRDILKLRAEEAAMLGFANYAELSLAPKMADTPAEVTTFLRDLAVRAKPFAEKDRAELEGFAKVELGMSELAAWDLAFVSEKLRVARYAFSEQDVKPYFPEPRVLAGLFGVVKTLYGIDVVETSAETWHPDVRFFEIRQDGSKLGEFYLDLYARAQKRGGAWMDDARGRRSRAGDTVTPVAYLTCNFSAPVGGKPALFSHDEVTTLFHEFGHGLHHLLTRIDVPGVSGISGVEWDAVELPSQFMENFCWEWDVLQGMTAHVDSGEPLPRALFDKMLAARNFQSGMMTVRQIEFSLFDMLLHSEFSPEADDWEALLAEVRREVAVNLPPAYNRFVNSFSHIFAGGYAAGYYSYKWAEVLSADAYAAFEEQGGANPDTGRRFWNEILAVGGSRPAMESFKAFRGREPELEPLLRHNGMLTAG
ncbi:M3 family metallopeptidase [Laribacter hongkongensis]|uniref:M3 family metallopeptidase n=1 Tax=Laribacter hongkongensis TaxID=168471 RepID=UPI001EFCEED4|nr:M3 family metallopeptidase [Laribacter hongkongensis]MCG9029610.1 M3 family metallopeptidase [Laribacter hongkongensis]MCG9035278.1 M3 family metallopeptidase [Laribacter hongkongensis]MCG9039136.1 M3 family metallopeptidase [Laribacter hongkongensis]MCG9071400.1 M3 family metallopeptidase [Laribacter hongkongensis]MCG9073672.1 M3 family metallopeptidase [Laribacter hongkongensis]